MHERHAHPVSQGALAQAFVLTALVLAVEVAGGLVGHSLALLADAGHVLTDVVVMALGWIAVRQAARPADDRRTFGYQRAGILVALLNGGLLVLVVFAVMYQAFLRLSHPQPVEGRVVVGTALVAIAVNGYIATRLRSQHHDYNARAVLLHAFSDLAASVGVVVSGVIVLLTGFFAVDPLVSIAISLLILWSAVRLVLDTTNILLEGMPRHLDLGELRAAMHAVPSVAGIHDLHVWTLSGSDLALSAHVVAADPDLSGEDGEHLVRALEQILCDRFAIGHTTIQVEVCHPCAGEPHVTGAGAHNHPHPRV